MCSRSGSTSKRPRPRRRAGSPGRFGLAIPQDAVDDDLEESARFYEEDNGELHIRSDFLIEATTMP
jgi:magnesium transporter